MNGKAYFFDTYAFLEVLEGNEAYKGYEEAGAITTIFNLAELNYIMKKQKGGGAADRTTRKYCTILVDVAVEDVMNAMDLKMKNKKLSIPDAIGYTIAKKHGVKFLTGDKEFEGMPNVEFVK